MLTSSQSILIWHHVNSSEWATMGIFTPWKLANAKSELFFAKHLPAHHWKGANINWAPRICQALCGDYLPISPSLTTTWQTLSGSKRFSNLLNVTPQLAEVDFPTQDQLNTNSYHHTCLSEFGKVKPDKKPSIQLATSLKGTLGGRGTLASRNASSFSAQQKSCDILNSL